MSSNGVALAMDRAASLTRLADLVELTKLRIALMVLVTVATGFLLGSSGSIDIAALTAALVGTGLVAAGSSVVNQILERDTDAGMPRTRNRPLPAGRLSCVEAWRLAGGLTLAGLFILWLQTPAPTTFLAASCFVLYAWVYTPLKRLTVLNTAIGAVPGALPAVIGWSAATGSVSGAGWILFSILYLWQFPHFYAIAWLYRDDYAAAGLRMLPGTVLGRKTIGLQVVSYCLALLPVSLLPCGIEGVGATYAAIALFMGVYYLAFAAAFMAKPADRSAKMLMFASLIYLPTIFGALMIDAAGR